MSVFITGTDTGVGKTWFSVLLVRALRSAGIDAVGFKPIVCGEWDDVDELVEAGRHFEPREAVCPLRLKMPASPLTAARAEGIEIDPRILVEAYRDLESRHDFVVVEGVGGWLVPITPRYSVADLAVELNLPVIAVVQNRLGAINHTTLTAESIASRGLVCAGLVLNHPIAADDDAMRSNREILELLPVPRILCELSPGQRTLDLTSFSLLIGDRK